VACQRIQAFLEQPDQVESTECRLVDDEKKEESDLRQSICIEISENTTCYWGRTESKIDPVVAFQSTKSLELRAGNLYCVIGKCGSGKSAFLQALVGELTVSSGHIGIDGSKSISYASQEPWIMDGTAQENIVMGLSFDPAWYNRVVTACCLLPDFQAFRDGDQTILGDRGVQCSGGQMSRISLARALYCDSDVLVLDDPLSAVDSKVATTIFTEAIQKLGLHRDKCVILVTHQLQFTNGDQNICILMDKGTVACCGSFNDCSSKSSFDLSHALQSNDHVDDRRVPEDKTDRFQPRQIESEQISDQAFVEKRRTGVITKRTWLAYIEALGGKTVSVIFLVIFSLTQAAFLVTIFYVGLWAESSDQDSPYWFGIVFGLTAVTSFLAISRALISFYLLLQASKKLHNTMLSSVLRATVEFFDTNPLGRILNRFASDVGIVDEQLPLVIYEFGVGFIM
jgi:ATP-binding cassette subfamily C (CFTR/MRP) protein 4